MHDITNSKPQQPGLDVRPEKLHFNPLTELAARKHFAAGKDAANGPAMKPTTPDDSAVKLTTSPTEQVPSVHIQLEHLSMNICAYVNLVDRLESRLALIMSPKPDEKTDGNPTVLPVSPLAEYLYERNKELRISNERLLSILSRLQL